MRIGDRIKAQLIAEWNRDECWVYYFYFSANGEYGECRIVKIKPIIPDWVLIWGTFFIVVIIGSCLNVLK